MFEMIKIKVKIDIQVKIDKSSIKAFHLKTLIKMDTQELISQTV